MESKRIVFLLPFLLVPEEVFACSVCFGGEGPMVDGVVMGVWVLVGVVAAVLFLFARFFLSLLCHFLCLMSMTSWSAMGTHGQP